MTVQSEAVPVPETSSHIFTMKEELTVRTLWSQAAGIQTPILSLVAVKHLLIT